MRRFQVRWEFANSCSQIFTLIIDICEWISSIQVQNYYSTTYSNQKATQFNLYARNTGTEDWTLLKEVTGLTYSIAGQKRKIYLANNTPYTHFKFETFGSGDPSACAWRIQSLDLLVLYLSLSYGEEVLSIVTTISSSFFNH